MSKKKKFNVWLLLFAGLLTALTLYHIYLTKRVYAFNGLLFLCGLSLFTYALMALCSKYIPLKVRYVFGVAAFVFVLTEALLRLPVFSRYSTEPYIFTHISFYKTKYHLRKPNIDHTFECDEFNYTRHTNSLGLSDVEPPAVKNEGEKLIIGLGDSFTEGDGTHADSTWLKFLDRQLQQKHQKFSMLNAGMCGSDPFFEYVLLKDKLLNYNPDIVILALGFDIEEVVIRGGMQRFDDKGNVHFIHTKYWEPLYAVSHIFRFFVHEVVGLNEYFMKPEYFEKEKQRALVQIREQLNRFRELSIQNNFKLLVVFYPMMGEIENQKYTYWDKTIPHLEANDFATLDFLRYITAANTSVEDYSCLYWPKNGHMNALGYHVLADAIYQKMIILGWIDSLSVQQLNGNTEP